MAIGLFGGSFNPLHLGHIVIARETQFRLHLEQVIFIPTGQPPHKDKTSLLSDTLRRNMIQAVLSNYRGFTLSTIELESPEISYSIDTIRFFRSRMSPDEALFFIMGIDAYLELNTWRHYDKLLHYCHLAITNRNSEPWPEAFPQFDGLPSPDEYIRLVLDEEVAEHRKPVGNVYFLTIPGFDVSASMIRNRLKNGQPIDHLVPVEVNRYLMKQ